MSFKSFTTIFCIVLLATGCQAATSSSLRKSGAVGGVFGVAERPQKFGVFKRKNSVIQQEHINAIQERGGGASKARFVSTLQVIVSKLFPAGFAWQLASSVCGYDASSTKFALATGFGEAIGVFSGHVLFDYIMNSGALSGPGTVQTALLLATGTICSGTSWQPIVNTLQGMGLPFVGVFFGTWIFCTYAFNFGLRVARNLYQDRMSEVEGPTYENAKSDFALSLTIGAATAFFVGTDSAYKSSENFLLGLVGIADGTPLIKSCLLAGLSTALGFGVAQSIFNVVFPDGKCWID